MTHRNFFAYCNIYANMHTIVSIIVSLVRWCSTCSFQMSKINCSSISNSRIKLENPGTMSPHLIICWHKPRCLSVNSRPTDHGELIANVDQMYQVFDSILAPPWLDKMPATSCVADSKKAYTGIHLIHFPCVYIFKCHRPYATCCVDAWVFKSLTPFFLQSATT